MRTVAIAKANAGNRAKGARFVEKTCPRAPDKANDLRGFAGGKRPKKSVPDP